MVRAWLTVRGGASAYKCLMVFNYASEKENRSSLKVST